MRINSIIIYMYLILFSLCACTTQKSNPIVEKTEETASILPIYLGIKLGCTTEEYTKTLKELSTHGRLDVLDNGIAYEVNMYKNQSYILVPTITKTKNRITEIQFLAAVNKKDIGELIKNYQNNNYLLNIPIENKFKIRSGILEKLETMYGRPESTDSVKNNINSILGDFMTINKTWYTSQRNIKILFSETYNFQDKEESFSSMYFSFEKTGF